MEATASERASVSRWLRLDGEPWLHLKRTRKWQVKWRKGQEWKSVGAADTLVRIQQTRKKNISLARTRTKRHLFVLKLKVPSAVSSAPFGACILPCARSPTRRPQHCVWTLHWILWEMWHCCRLLPFSMMYLSAFICCSLATLYPNVFILRYGSHRESCTYPCFSPPIHIHVASRLMKTHILTVSFGPLHSEAFGIWFAMLW